MKLQRTKNRGFTLLEMVTVVAIIAIMTALAIPSFKGVMNLINNARCYLNQRHIRDAVLVYYTDRPFVDSLDGFGDGEIFIDLTGKVVGDSNRDLSDLIDNPKVFDCPSDGLAADGDTTPDYLTDGYIVTCLTDDATGLKSDGVAFVHDTPRNVLWMHDALTGVALSEAVPEPSPQPTPAPTPEPPVPVALFSDDFSKGAADRWLITSGKYFTFGDGYLTIGRDGSTGEHRAFSGDEGWTDYVVEVVATLDSGDGYGIYFRATDPKNTDAYIFQYDENYGSGAFLFRKVQDGKEQSPFARVYAGDTVFGKDFQWYGTERKIRIEVSGNEYRAYIDGELVVVGKDDSYTNGMVGLRTWVKGATTFESLVVTELKGE